jgi:hypothetical protein
MNKTQHPHRSKRRRDARSRGQNQATTSEEAPLAIVNDAVSESTSDP